ncbi:hypothetical protein CLU83_3329 [Flavobacterium sp. 1]|uniref:hypothetical protein n=1 Tax=Flavobacterium sp. 1 TaxID=2035200 RepID=UPI000C24038A|nr:hypothetical protein [Flavobacterium sp. 1]PJJ09946.1 hypothetical protein CLU83_3329 [Flavobacterium sp. 1]
MIEKVLTNLAYLFYPTNICSRTQESQYFNSEEYKRLLKTIKYFQNNSNIYIKLKEEFNNDNVLANFRNASLLDWQDRTINFELSVIENGELYTLSLLLSVLVPFYVIMVKKNKIELFFSTSEITQMKDNNLESRTIKDLIIDITMIVENKFLYKKFPEQLMNFIIEDVSFQEIQKSNFTMFNAFFNNLVIDEN